MPFHHDSHIRPTADWINRYASDLLASAPGMHPLDAVRRAMEATADDAPDSGHHDDDAPAGSVVRPRAGPPPQS
jgi:hypothetical protein